MKNPIIYGISLYLFVMSMALPAYGMYVGGFASTAIESVTYTTVSGEEVTSVRWNNYLNLGVGELVGMRELSFYGYGRYNVGIQDEDTFGDLYLAYLDYRAFQNATHIMLGRFDLINNRFMTLDGVSATQRLPFYVGLSGFVGVPRYREVVDSKDEFRMTGAMAYGGRVFLSGIESFQANVNFYNESGDDDNGDNIVYKRTVGAGGSYFKNYGTLVEPKSVAAEALVDQDVENDVIQRISTRLAGQYYAYQMIVFYDKFDVRDQYPEHREFVIRLLSNGKETRYGGRAMVDVTDWLNLYGGLTLTTISKGEVVEISYDGMITKLGADISLPYSGLSTGAEYYYYGSDLEKANGVTAYMDWQFARDFILYLGADYAWVTEGTVEREAYSVECRLSAWLTQDIMSTALVQVGDGDSKYVDNLRWGLQVKYVF
jgi:hypothetical protein